MGFNTKSWSNFGWFEGPPHFIGNLHIMSQMEKTLVLWQQRSISGSRVAKKNPKRITTQPTMPTNRAWRDNKKNWMKLAGFMICFMVLSYFVVHKVHNQWSLIVDTCFHNCHYCEAAEEVTSGSQYKVALAGCGFLQTVPSTNSGKKRSSPFFGLFPTLWKIKISTYHYIC